jgi:hypothetical protein
MSQKCQKRSFDPCPFGPITPGNRALNDIRTKNGLRVLRDDLAFCTLMYIHLEPFVRRLLASPEDRIR